MSSLKNIHNLLDNNITNANYSDQIEKEIGGIVNLALSNGENLIDKQKGYYTWYNKIIRSYTTLLNNNNNNLINILEKFISTIDLEDNNIDDIFDQNFKNLSEDNKIKLYNSLLKNKIVSNDKKIEIINYFINLREINLKEKTIYDLIIRFPNIFDHYLFYTKLKISFISYCYINHIDINDDNNINNIYKIYYNLLNLFKNKKYEDSREIIALYYHLSLYDKLNNNMKSDSAFFNFCFSTEYLNYILEICKQSYDIKCSFISGISLSITEKQRNKLNFDINSRDDKIVKKLEYFFNNKINPTKEMLINIAKFYINILKYNSNYNYYYIKNIEKNTIYDFTSIVNCFVYFGYKLTSDDLCDLLENYCVITNFNDYEIDLKIEKYYDIVSKINCEPYNINVPYNIDNLREHCKTKTTFIEISKILEKNHNLKLDNICLQNLCLSSEYPIIKNIMLIYNLKSDCICIYNAYKSEKSKICIQFLFMNAFSDEIKKYNNQNNNQNNNINIDNESKISEKENKPIEIIPKKKICKR